MSIIAKCDYCVLEGATYRRQTEIYDGILPDVMMCSNCGYAALFERERIIKVVTDSQAINPDQKYFLLKAIKGEQK